MQADYLHQQVLAKAIKKLYMLGHRPYHQQTGGIGEIGSAVGNGAAGAISANEARKAQQALILDQIRQKHEADMRQEASDVEFIKGHSPNSPVKSEDYLVREGQALPKNPGGMNEQQMFEQQLIDANQEKYKDYQSMQDQNDTAESTRMGGQYTGNGLDEAMRNADLNASDRLKMKGLLGNPNVGIGGSQY